MPPNKRINELEDLGEVAAEDLVLAQRQGQDGYVSLDALVGLIARVEALERGAIRRPELVLVADHLTVTGGESVNVEAVAHDPDGTVVSYDFTTSLGAVVVPKAAEPSKAVFTAPATTAQRQEAVLSCTIVDDEGGRATAHLVFIVRAQGELNRLPTIDRFTASLERVAGGEAFVVTAEATDPEGERLTYLFATDKGEIAPDRVPDVTDPPGLARATVTAPAALVNQEQTVTVTCTVRDPEGAQDVSTLEVTVAGRAAGALIYATYGADQTVTPTEFLAGESSEDEDGRITVPTATQAGYLKFALSVDHFGRAGDMREEGGISNARSNFIPAAGDADVVVTIDGLKYYTYVENAQTAARFSGGTWIIRPE